MCIADETGRALIKCFADGSLFNNKGKIEQWRDKINRPGFKEVVNLEKVKTEPK